MPSSSPVNKRLYKQVTNEAKRRFKVWPSIYASSWIVAEYKRRGGTYKGRKNTNGLTQWYRETWIDVCQLPDIVPCGRSQTNERKYPYCRPLYKISKTTPKIASKLSKKEIERRCEQKRANPKRKVR
jgi:hypothetical protein